MPHNEDIAALVQRARESYAEAGLTTEEADQRIVETAVRVAKSFPVTRSKAVAVLEYLRQSKSEVKKEADDGQCN